MLVINDFNGLSNYSSKISENLGLSSFIMTIREFDSYVFFKKTPNSLMYV